MAKTFWTKERKEHYLKLVEKELKRAQYIKSYMARKRAEGKIKHWRQYKFEKEKNGITKIQQSK
tara:strand:+ start:1812 stop:2003 length:192 start_codon:yes stop_codon:yes gene_type:complete